MSYVSNITELTSGAPALRLHHRAYKCRNSEETRHFYEDILDMPLAHAMEVRDLTATTGEVVDFLHTFFELADGSCIAFFDLGDGKRAVHDVNTPEFSTRFSMLVSGEEALQAIMRRLNKYNVPFEGPVEHQGYLRSIYLKDPNDIRIEFSYEIAADKLDVDVEARDKSGRDILRNWVAEHAAN
jgi:catechol 2,3-dioxygenase-like lactoylglutathione lyase family enzyme